MYNSASKKITGHFLNYLSLTGLTGNSLRFYKSDVTHFEKWLCVKLRKMGLVADDLQDSLPFLQPEVPSEYKKFLLTNEVPATTINRRLSTLRQLAKFLMAKEFLSFDFTLGLTNLTPTRGDRQSLLFLAEEFEKHLVREKAAKNTIKNYLADVRHFLTWLDNHQP